MKDMATIIGVTVEEFQSTTSDLAPAGATSLPVGLLVDFDPSGGSALLGDDLAVDPVVSYIDVDYDTYSIILEAPLAVAVDADTPVKCLNARGEVERSKKVLVDRGEDDDEDTIEATVDLRLDAHFPEGEELAGLWVEIESDGDEWRVVSTPFDQPLIQALYIHAPRGLASRSTAQPISSGLADDVFLLTRDAAFSTAEWTLDLGRLTYHGPPCVVVAYAGVKWAANSTGFRRVIIRQSSDAESLVVNQIDPDTSGAASYQSVSGVFTLADGEAVYMDVRHSSGGSLDILEAELRAAIVGYQQ